MEVLDSSPSTAFSAASRGSLTCLSTTAGDAPGMAETTVICGNSILGMSSCLREPSVITPNTIAKTVIRAISARFPRDILANLNIKPLSLIHAGPLQLCRGTLGVVRRQLQ